MSDVLELTVPPAAAGQVLRVFLADSLPLDPEDFLRQLTIEGKVTLGGEPIFSRQVMRAGDVVQVHGLAEARAAYKGELVRAPVLYEDEHILVLDKPAGCTVVRERRSDICPFQAGVLAHLRKSPQSAEAALRTRYRPRAVHRLDRETTGAVIVAKSREGELHLTRQFQDRTIRKEYLAIVCGEPASDRGQIDAAIAEREGDIERMVVGERDGKRSLTSYEVVERFHGYALVRAEPSTGRRHQIRLHLAHIGHPVLADRLYGGGTELLLSSLKRRYKLAAGEKEKPLIARPALHARALQFLPVGRDEPLRVEAPLPRDMEVALKMLRKHAGR